MALQSINASTGELLRSFPTLNEEALRVRIEQAAGAAKEQRNAPVEHRALCLRKLSHLLTEDSAEIARTIALETGKPIRLATAEVALCVQCCRFYAEHAGRLLAPEVLQAEGGKAYVQWSAMGVVLAVLSWDSPFWSALRFVIPAVLGGNAVLLKHASTVPQCAVQMEALVRRAGFARGALSALLIDDQLVEQVLADERVVAVTMTGPESAGRALGAQAGWQLKKCALHLPGCDALLVMPSADLNAAVAAAVRALTGGAGPYTGKRLVIEASVYEDFMQHLKGAVELLRVGDPLKEETEVGCLGTAEAVRTLVEQVDAAVLAGGRIVAGGARREERGHFFPPTILNDVPRNAAVARDALAGPVAMVFRARDLAEGIAIANDSPFGLGASVWTKEPGEQQQMIAGMDAGAVSLNALPGEDGRFPYGGSKRSGYGRELGSAGLREFMQPKTVVIGT